MVEKAHIVDELGEGALLLPSLLAQALAANDRLKLGLTLLQEAAQQAGQPGRTAPTLAAERRAAGLDDPQFEATIAGARSLSPGRLLVPGVKAIVDMLRRDLGVMLAPLQAAHAPDAALLEQRREALLGVLPDPVRDEIAVDEIQAMASARHEGPDSLHRLVMDAHKAINAVAAQSALEKIDGAHVHHVEPVDRPRIRAFMTGLRRTAVLAFGHPGLGTTAARSGDRLTIQNDIGETDAHVIVIHVTDDAVTVTYTDVHRRRARFFMAMFESERVTWTAPTEKQVPGFSEDVFYLVTGRHDVTDEQDRLRFLEHLGSRLVYLIDWNKARKALQTFVGKSEAIEILGWAAERDFGHRAFLELGGSDLVFEAVRRTAAGRIPYGARLDAVLGTSECVRFLESVLRQTSQGLRQERSQRLIRDQVQADLAQLFDTADIAVLALLGRHLGISRTLAAAIAEQLGDGSSPSADERDRLVRRARLMEEKADRLTLQARELCGRLRDGGALHRAIDAAENATDALDEAAFLWAQTPPVQTTDVRAALADLAAIVIDGLGEMIRATEAAVLQPQGNRLDSAAALQAIDAVSAAERRADAAERSAVGALTMQAQPDARPLVLGLEFVRALEGTTDHLAHAALSLRDHVLGELAR